MSAIEMTHNEKQDHPSGRARVVSILGTAAGVIGAVATAVALLWSVLNWMYVELGSLRTLSYETKTEIAETKATLNAVAKQVEKIDVKIDRLTFSVPKTPRKSDDQ